MRVFLRGILQCSEKLAGIVPKRCLQFFGIYYKKSCVFEDVRKAVVQSVEITAIIAGKLKSFLQLGVKRRTVVDPSRV
jgi:hypothetical protein